MSHLYVFWKISDTQGIPGQSWVLRWIPQYSVLHNEVNLYTYKCILYIQVILHQLSNLKPCVSHFFKRGTRQEKPQSKAERHKAKLPFFVSSATLGNLYPPLLRRFPFFRGGGGRCHTHKRFRMTTAPRTGGRVLIQSKQLLTLLLIPKERLLCRKLQSSQAKIPIWFSPKALSKNNWVFKKRRNPQPHPMPKKTKPQSPTDSSIPYATKLNNLSPSHGAPIAT